MSIKVVAHNIKEQIAAKTPIICLVSDEERRIERLVKELAQKAFGKPIPLFIWNCVEGVTGETGVVPNTTNILDALNWVLKQEETVFILFKDIKYYLASSPFHIRLIKDIYQKFYQSFSTVFFLTNDPEIPPDILNEIHIIDVSLPVIDEVEEILDKVIDTRKNSSDLSESLTADLREKIVKSSLGLGQDDIERLFARISKDKTALMEQDVDLILEEKHQIISKSGVLEFIPLEISIDNLGGMDNLKSWLKRRQTIFTQEARDFGLQFPKGIMVMGISGCGKSILVKACASFWNIPLIRLEMGRVYDETLGTPEASLRLAIKIAEACSPCVLWVDEIEAGIANAGAKSAGGAPSRVIAQFLTWMQEKKTPVFVGATANEIELVPPEFIRKGRFDEIFYVTLPTIRERGEIFGIHLRKRGIDPTKINLDNLAKAADGFNGAEIEQAVISSQFEAFQKKRPVTEDDIYVSIGRIVPLSTTMKEEIKRLERWAFNRTVKASRER